nr:reverse transcriptase domain-containing protein [Tanacetum cinerariifolium]
MADQRTMTELLRAPTEGYAEAVVVPLILAEKFELKHSLINMMTSDQFFGLEKDNLHDHIRCAHPYYQCLATGGNTFPELRDNIQGYIAAAAVNYNQGNSVYRPLGMANQIRPLRFAQPNVQNNQNRFSQPQGYNRGNNFNPEQSYQALT